MSKKADTASEKAKKKGSKPAISPRSGSDVTKYQFKKGKPGGPGRPSTRKIKDILNERFTDEQWTEFLDKMWADAARGDAQARKLLMEYKDGKPPQSLDVTSKGDQIRGAIIDYTG